MALSRMQDIAGARLVAEMNWTEQDQLVARIVELFPSAEVKDRRAEPSYGYRAVHVIVEVDRRLVEIQVRTVLQDLWAQVVERLADRWGRGIRYGDLPNDPDAEAFGAYTRRQIIDLLMEQSKRNHELERFAVELARMEALYAASDKLFASVEAEPRLMSHPGVAERLAEARQGTQERKRELQEAKKETRRVEEETREFFLVLRSLE